MDIRKQLTRLAGEYKYVALILGVGLVLMLLPGKEEAPHPEPEIPAVSSAQEQLEDILSQIQGVGKVRLLLTVAQGEQTIYLRDTDGTRQEAVLVTGADRAQTGLVSQVLSPSYLGAVVVCQGGDQPGVRLAVVEAVCDATGLTADKISVLKMK